MKTLAFENVLEKFISEYKDDPDAMKKERKRIEYGQYWCETHEWKFLYGRIEDVSIFFFIDTYYNADYRDLWRTYIWDH
jgi:hypothetical protein